MKTGLSTTRGNCLFSCLHRVLICLSLLLVYTHSTFALVITPTWDSSITSDPNAATIQSTINTAIQSYQSRFSDPVTVTINFKEMTSGLGQSQFWFYTIGYSQFRTSLKHDATSLDDTNALNHLPTGLSNPVTGTSSVILTTANLRAIGITGDDSGLPGGVDGIISLNTSLMNLSRTSINPSKYDLLATVEHEIDEVLGTGSTVGKTNNPFPMDLFRYTSSGTRSFTTNGDDAYFSLDGTTLLARFNQTSPGDYGDWWTAGAHTPQVQDAFATPGATPNLGVELRALDAIGYTLQALPQPGIKSTVISGANLTINATNGVAGQYCSVLMSTNITSPLSQWTALSTNFLSNSGNFVVTVTNGVSATQLRRFFALQVQ